MGHASLLAWTVMLGGIAVLAALVERARLHLRATRAALRRKELELAALTAGIEGDLTVRPAAELLPEELDPEPSSRDYSALDDAGAVRYLRETRIPVLEAGRVVAVATHVRDVSDQRVALAQMDAASGQVHSFLNAAPDATLLVDDAGRVQYANAQLAVLLGYFMDELLGRPVVDLVPGVEPVRRQMGKTAPVTAHHRDGHPIQVDVALAPVAVGSGGPWTLAFLRDATAQQRAEQALRDAQDRYRFLAEHDALTGLVNRRRFERELDNHLVSCRTEAPRGALLAIDLDNFKAVNDTLGHHVGDQLVTAVAHALRSAVRDRDVVARQGGDEFLVLLRDGDAVTAAQVADRLLLAVRDGARVLPDPRVQVSGSIGMVAFDQIPIGDLTAENALIEADAAMYAAKEAGRGRSVGYQDATGSRRAS